MKASVPFASSWTTCVDYFSAFHVAVEVHEA